MIEGILFAVAVNTDRLVIEETPFGWRLMAKWAGMKIHLASLTREDVTRQQIEGTTPIPLRKFEVVE